MFDWSADLLRREAGPHFWPDSCWDNNNITLYSPPWISSFHNAAYVDFGAACVTPVKYSVGSELVFQMLSFFSAHFVWLFFSNLFFSMLLGLLSTRKQHFSAHMWTTSSFQPFFFWILFPSLITCTCVFLPSFSQLGFELIRFHLSIFSRSWLFFSPSCLPASNHHQPCGFISSWINISASESFLLTLSTSGSFQLVIIVDMKVAKVALAIWPPPAAWVMPGRKVAKPTSSALND